MTTPASPAARFLRFLGKVQFTMVLLLAGAVAMVAGTVLEARVGVEAAQAFVYRTLWFNAYLFLIVVNLVVAVVNRIPIQRHQWAFVLTHASIVLLMFGAWISATFGYEGRLAILEGSSANRLALDETELRVQGQSGTERSATLGRGLLAGRLVWPGSADTPELRIAEHVPHGEYRAQLVTGSDTDGPGVTFHLGGAEVHRDDWLIGEHRFFRRKDAGPVEIEMVVARSPEFLQERLPARDSAAAVVELRPVGGGTPVRIDLPAQLQQDVPLGAGVRAKVVRQLARARVGDDGLIDSPDAPANPAVVVEVTDGTHTESLTLFSEFPQFNLTRGRDQEHPLVGEVRLAAVAVGNKPLVSILLDAASGQLYVQLSAAQGRGPGLAFERGQTVGIGNLGIDLQVSTYLPHAQPSARVVAVAPRASGQPWMRIVARDNGAEAGDWLRFGSSAALEVGGRRVVVGWQNATLELPFELALDKFDVTYHPGSRRPAQYASHIRVRDRDGGEQVAVVSMNRPLDHAGFRFFQSSYQLGEMGQPDQTVLSVSRDPGVAIVYPAFVLLIVGVAWYLIGSGRRARVAAGTDPALLHEAAPPLRAPHVPPRAVAHS